VAAAVGFADEFHLSRLVKKHFGISPSGYRREHAYHEAGE
jgi:AraC-like DNA-binding protein